MRKGRDRRRGLEGDYLMIDDRSGFVIWGSDSQKEWTGARVYRRLWEPRHPQDFVRGKREDFAVPDGRPVADPSLLPQIGPYESPLTVQGNPGDLSVVVQSIAGFRVGDSILITLDDSTFYATILSVPINVDSTNIRTDALDLFVDSTQSIAINKPLPGIASIGNFVANMSNSATAPLI
jgi:hypothetical protein